MLQRIRDRITGGYAIAFLALLSVPFLFFGINYDFTGGAYAAKVDGVEISAAQLQNAYLSELSRFSEQGTDIPANLRPLVRQSVLNNLIRETLVNQYIAEQGYRITDQMVTDAIQRQPDFQVDGRFSRDEYYTWLQQRGLTPTMFEESQRSSLRLQQFQRSMGATAFVTPGEYRRYLNLYREQRRAAVARLDVDAIAEEVEVTDEEVAAHYEEHASEFMTRESVDVRYLLVDRAELREQIEIDEQALTEYYEQSADRYRQDERRQARHILIPFGDDRDAAREQAESLAARAQAGEPFEDLARQYSADGLTAEQGGDLGPMAQSQLPEALAGPVFSMAEGEIEGPIESRFGFHVVKLEGIEAGGPMPLAQVRAELERELRDMEVEQAYQDFERALYDALFDAQDIEQMAEAVGLEIRSAGGITRQGGGPFGGNQAVIDAVFDQTLRGEDTVSDVIELDANRAAVFSVERYHEPARQPLEEVRDLIVARLSRERAETIAEERAAELTAAVRGGADLETAAGELGAEVTPMRLIGRQDAETDPRVLEAIFRAQKPASPDGATVGRADATDGDYVVYALAAVLPGRPESVPQEERDQGKLRLAQEAGIAEYTALVLELERRADIVIAEDALATPEF